MDEFHFGRPHCLVLYIQGRRRVSVEAFSAAEQHFWVATLQAAIAYAAAAAAAGVAAPVSPPPPPVRAEEAAAAPVAAASPPPKPPPPKAFLPKGKPPGQTPPPAKAKGPGAAAPGPAPPPKAKAKVSAPPPPPPKAKAKGKAPPPKAKAKSVASGKAPASARVMTEALPLGRRLLIKPMDESVDLEETIFGGMLDRPAASSSEEQQDGHTTGASDSDGSAVTLLSRGRQSSCGSSSMGGSNMSELLREAFTPRRANGRYLEAQARRRLGTQKRSLLDNRTAQNVEIVLKKLPVSCDALRLALERMDFTVALSGEDIKSIMYWDITSYLHLL